MRLTHEMLMKYGYNGSWLNPYQLKALGLESAGKGWLKALSERELTFEEFQGFKNGYAEWNEHRFNLVDLNIVNRKIHKIVEETGEGAITFPMVAFRHKMRTIIGHCGKFIDGIDVEIDAKNEILSCIVRMRDAVVRFDYDHRSNHVDVDDNGVKGRLSVTEIEPVIEQYRPKVRKIIVKRKVK